MFGDLQNQSRKETILRDNLRSNHEERPHIDDVHDFQFRLVINREVSDGYWDFEDLKVPSR